MSFNWLDKYDFIMLAYFALGFTLAMLTTDWTILIIGLLGIYAGAKLGDWTAKK